MLFKTRRFGAFIHFGIYSQNEWHEQDQLRRSIPKAEYIKLADTFNPADFDADRLVKWFKEAGAEYICFTTKHHDGFCMWDTKYTDYNIMNTPYGKDILKELAEACEKYDIYLELYYSCPDWHHKNSVNLGEESHQLPCPNPDDEPNDDLYVEYVKNQVTELLTNYGKIRGFFWDIPPKRRDKSVNELVRKLQPGILINDRGYDEGDYSTPEREACIRDAKFDRLCEACQSVGMQSWAYRKNEDYFTPASLIASISSIMIKGGNYLLNVGPKPDGTIPPKSKQIFEAVADWYKRVRESLIETDFLKIGKYCYTLKDNNLYLHLPPSFSCCGAVLSPITVAPERAIILNNGEEIPAVIEYTPVDYWGADSKAHLHISNIPANELLHENIVIRLEYKNIGDVLDNVDIERGVIL